MDGDLFMECEEEELEPWQQMYDDVEEDEEELEFIEGDNDNVCDASFTTAHKTAVPSVHPGNSSVAQQVPATVSNPVLSSASLLTPTAAPVVSSVIPQFMVPTGSPSVPPLMPTGLVQGQQLIQIQTPTGLSTMLLPAAGNTGAGPANAQQIFFTQGFPVQNVRPAQKPMGIVLNLQQGQMIRPITLLSGPGGQFFAPAMGMPQVVTQPAQIRPSTAPSGGATQAPASTFATMHIPATLTIRTAGSAGHATPATTAVAPGLTRTTVHCPASQPQMLKVSQAPVALQSQILQVNDSPASGPVAPLLSQGNKVDQVLKICPRCGAQYKMPEALQGHMCFCCPDLVNTAKPSTSAGPLNPVSDRPRAPTSNPDPMPKVVMLVDDFYYGRFEGEPTPVDSQTSKLTFSFKCILCPKRSNSNIRLMDHIMQHPEMTQGVDPLTFCEHCFRQFSTTAQLQHHMENVHGPMQTSSCCKICEWAFDSEPVFLHHMKSTHKPGEMPYICQVCEYRSSFYSDVFNHFRSTHAMTCNQLCVYCLKVFKSPNSYQQHFVRHQGSKLSHCNKCRLQFVSSSDRMEHKTRHHRTFRKPKQLEGLQPGTKVTIRAYAHHKGALPKNIPLDYKTTGPTPQAGQANINNVQQKLHQPKTSPQTTQITTRKSTKQLDLLTKFQKQRVSVDKQRCMECSADVSSFPDHYPTFVHCAVCPYSTCCSRSYADHMITNHAPSMKTNHVPLHKQPPPCYLKLRCAGCDFISQTGDLMAKHLGQFPGHGSSNCTQKEYLESDIDFCQEDEEETGEDLEVKPEWALMENWREPSLSGGDCQLATILDFTESCGPCHSLHKNSDAIDYFNLLFPYSLMELIASETNAYAKTCQFLGQRDLDWVPVTAHEIKGFIGLSILMGLQSLPEPANYWSWQHYDNCHTFFRAMSVKRFQQISTNIRMGSTLISTEEKEGGSDMLSVFRPLLNILGDSMWKAYQPNRCLTIDRALLPSLETEAGQVKGSPKAQPGVWLLCDSKSGYCHRLLVHTRRENVKELGFSVVPTLVEGLQEKHHQLFLGSSLASVPLMHNLLDEGIYASSSFPPPSPIFPRELWEHGQLKKPGDYLQRQFGPLLATRWKDTKEMGCLSTNAVPGQPDTVWRKSQTKVGELSPIDRPLAFRLLQENMRGVDICKQLLACNPLGGLPLDKHWRSLFWFLVNLSIVNAFIVLRESRKDNPPPWVQDGLFTQANFRKRLGHQLAKCAERQARIHSEIKEGPAGLRDVALQGNPNTLRHRLVKLTAKTKRCKNCNLKNLRHESVFGCIVCKANLCKRPSCFWEYHGFSPHHLGSPKVGFINEDMRNTMEADRFDDCSEWGPLGPESDLDEAMAPVEDVATDTDDEEAEFEALAKNKGDIFPEGESKQQPVLSEPPVAPPIERPVVKEREDTLSVRLLRIVLFALCCGVRQAAKQLSTQPSLIRAWLKEKEKQLERDGRGPGKGEAVERMVEWVMAQREQQLPVNEKNLFQRASEIHSQGGHSSSFRISYDWAVSFMLQHNLGWHAVGQTPMVNRRLPRSMEDNINSYIKFTHKHIQAHNLPHTDIAATDELSVFVDFEALTDPAKVDKEGALQLVGTRDPLVTIYLTALANGTMLPTLVLFKGQLPEMQDKGLPNSVLLKAKVEGFTRDEELALWESLVWRKHMLDQSRSTKGMLILDSHRGHMSKDFLTSLGATATLPAVVPAGCTCRLQPLEMCVRPVLQSFLLARWARLAAQGGAAGATQKDLVQLLVAWLVEALACLEKQPDLLQQSFHLTDVVPGQRDQEMAETQAEIQSKLMGTLREALLGPENLEVESPTELVQEDSMGTEDMEARVEQVVYEEQDVGQGQVDEEQGCGKVKVDDKQKNGGKVNDSRKAAIEMDMDTTECNILEKREERTVS